MEIDFNRSSWKNKNLKVKKKVGANKPQLASNH